MGILHAQTRIPGGPSIFRTLAAAEPAAGIGVQFAGLRFPSPVGLGSGLDVDGRAAPLMQELGLGFLELGPLGVRTRRTSAGTNPRRHRHTRALAMSGCRGGPSIGEALALLPELKVPVGIRVRGERLVAEVELASTRADFITLPTGAGGSRTELSEVRAATARPLLVRVHASWSRGQIDRVIENATAAGIDGAIVVADIPCSRLDDGELVWRGALSDALEVISRIDARLPASLAGGVLTPEDAESALAANARLTFLSDGLVFAGPGLPKRINTRLARSCARAPETAREAGPEDGGARKPAVAAGPAPRTRATVERAAIPLLLAVAAATIVAGIAYLVLAAVAPLLPAEARYVGLGNSQLCGIDNCRLVDFIAHGRACYGGVLIAVGVMYGWLVLGPLRRGEVWAWWTLLFAGLVAQGSYLTSLIYRYVDVRTAVFVLVLTGLWSAGLILVRPRMQRWRGPVAAFRTPEAGAWIWSPAGRGRLLVFLFAAGLATGGSMVLTIAGGDVFVPQDLQFIGIDPHRLTALSRHLVPVMAHDRAGFGGGLLALGVMFAATAQKGLRPGARGAWRAIGISGAALIVFVFAAHIAVGYLNVIHLSPAYSGAVLLALTLVTLRTPLRTGSYDEPAFPDV